jgi:glycosyltransferase involved in cell wall biosynthesis
VVATNAEGVREVLKDERFGVVVGIQDTNSLVQGITTVLTDENITDRAAALQHVVTQDFTWNKVTQSYSDLFENSLQ